MKRWYNPICEFESDVFYGTIQEYNSEKQTGGIPMTTETAVFIGLGVVLFIVIIAIIVVSSVVSSVIGGAVKDTLDED